MTSIARYGARTKLVPDKTATFLRWRFWGWQLAARTLAKTLPGPTFVKFWVHCCEDYLPLTSIGRPGRLVKTPDLTGAPRPSLSSWMGFFHHYLLLRRGISLLNCGGRPTNCVRNKTAPKPARGRKYDRWRRIGRLSHAYKVDATHRPAVDVLDLGL